MKDELKIASAEMNKLPNENRFDFTNDKDPVLRNEVSGKIFYIDDDLRRTQAVQVVISGEIKYV